MQGCKDVIARDTFDLSLRVFLKADVEYMITCNVDTSDGRINGASGICRRMITECVEIVMSASL